MMSGLEVADWKGSRVGRGYFRYDVGEATGEGHLRSEQENEQGVGCQSRKVGGICVPLLRLREQQGQRMQRWGSLVCLQHRAWCVYSTDTQCGCSGAGGYGPGVRGWGGVGNSLGTCVRSTWGGYMSCFLLPLFLD